MGIKKLNTFLNQFCRNETFKKHFSELYGKKVTVDIMIYIYKYAAERTIIEGIYLLCSLFKKYNIIPIFVFDGKTPQIKQKLIEKRRDRREKSQIKYNELLKSSDINTPKIKQKLLSLKRDSIKLKKSDIIDVKTIIDCFGYTYMVADYEADKLCAELVISNIAYACISEDTDLFVYGCPRILRYLNLFNEVCILYDFNLILEKLKMNLKTFKKFCILSGCDYKETSLPIFKVYNLYLKYIKKERKVPFMEWINNWGDDYEIENQVLSMYDCEKKEKISITNKNINKSALIEVLKKDNFIFV